MFCTNCGNQVPDNMNFCTNCGSPVKQNSKKEWITGTPPPKTENKAKKNPPKEYWQGQPPMNIDVHSNPVTIGNQDSTMYVLPDNSADPTQAAYNYDPAAADGSSMMFPQNHDFTQGYSDEPPKKKPGLVLKIVAIALVITILASVTSVGILSAINKSELKAEGITYIGIDEFPVLKNESELIVYDAEEFPATVYGIEVQRFLIGGALRNLNITEEVFTDEVSAPSYYLNLDDGEYRITLQGLTNYPSQVDTSKVITVIIDVEVDDDNPEALDIVNLRGEAEEKEETSTEATTANDPDETPTTPDMIVAAQSDFNELEKMLNATIGYWSDYSPEFDYRTATTEAVVDSVIFGNEGAGYEYFFGTKVNYDETVSEDQPEYAKLPIEDIKWICEKIYHISFNKNFKSDNVFARGNYCYVKNPAAADGCTTEYEIAGNKVVNNKYEVTVDVFTDSIAMGRSKENYGLKVIADIQNIDREKYWTIYSIEKTDNQSAAINGQPSTQNKKPDIEATESDFETLADILLALNFTEFDSKSATTAYAIDYMLTGEVASWGYDYFYKDILRNPTSTDPQNRFGTNYRVMSASNIEWICENVLNITYDPGYSSSKSYVQNGKVYRKTLPVSETVNYFATLSSYKVVNKRYEVTGEYYSAPVGTTSVDSSATLIGKFIITAELKNVNGKEIWTIYSIKSV